MNVYHMTREVRKQVSQVVTYRWKAEASSETQLAHWISTLLGPRHLKMHLARQ